MLEPARRPYRTPVAGDSVHIVPMVGARVCQAARVVRPLAGQVVQVDVRGEPMQAWRGYDEPYRGSWHFPDEGLCEGDAAGE